MTTATLSYLKVQKRALGKVGDITFLKANWKVIYFAMFFICLALLIYYVWQVRYLTSGSYLVVSYEKQVEKLFNDKNDLEVSSAENSFLGQVRQRIHDLNFQKTTSVKYIQLPDNYLARAK